MRRLNRNIPDEGIEMLQYLVSGRDIEEGRGVLVFHRIVDSESFIEVCDYLVGHDGIITMLYITTNVLRCSTVYK